MEIDKVTFESLSGINSAFEQLDVNNDGLINSKDLTAASDNNLKNEIKNMLDCVDTDSDVADDTEVSEDDEIENTTKEITILEKEISKKEAQKKLIEYEQQQIEKILKNLQDDLVAAEDDDTKQDIQQKIRCKNLEQNLITSKLSGLAKSINAKAETLNSLNEKLNTLKTKETEKAQSPKTNSDDKTQNTTLEKNSYGLNVLNSENFENAFDNATGVQYVVLTLPNCGRCESLMRKLQDNLSEEELQNIGAYNTHNKNYSNSHQYMEDVVATVNGELPGSYPKVLKLVNGQPVELIEYSNTTDMKNMIVNGIKNNS